MSHVLTSSPERPSGMAARRQYPSAWRWGFLEWFLIGQMVFPAILYLPGTQSIRVPIRISAYAMALLAMAWWIGWAKKTARAHPSWMWLIAALAYTALMVLHPTTNSALAGLAQVGLYFAVMSPVFWAADMVRSPQRLWRLLGILLVCNGINSVVGILQVYDPIHWLPEEFSVVSTQAYGGALTFTGPDGRQIVRPPGLSDSPGAVCGPAATAGLLGLIFCATPGLAVWKRAASLGFAFTGLAAIYLSNVRASLVILLASIVVYILILILQRERRRASMVLGSTMVIGIASLAFAATLGGSEIIDRFASLLAEDPQTVYYRGRGNQIDYALHVYLEQYPMGAGLGRWGMMRTYFGNESNTNSPFIGAEIQIPAWILDGGIVLVVIYSIALIVTAWQEWRFVRLPGNRALRQVAAAVFAANIGTLALVFSYTPFVAPIGLQYWFLTGCLFGAAAGTSRKGAGESAAEGIQ